MLNKLKRELKQHSSAKKAKIYARFFKTGKGQYGEGDVFLGLTVPEQRRIAQKYVDLGFGGIKQLLHSKYHEHRLTGLFILVYKYQKADDAEKQKTIDFYLRHRHRGNNWDLIDCIADKLLGKHIIGKDKSLLYEFAKSESLWDRRIAIIATFEFIRNGKFEDTIKISEILLNDKHDLIQKAVGWMLREAGKRNGKVLLKFLDRHHQKMPRTMLRYAVERLDEKKRMFYLGKF
ncbi:DNA alkylation repair protein [Candidatus Woesearchaeota archaeon]|nr:DNA alkylation repair protein [Candidatus Woesearchaeota archaeon]